MATLIKTRDSRKPAVSTYRVLRGRNQWRTATKVTFADGWIVRFDELVRDPAEAIRRAKAERFGAGLVRSRPTYRAPASFADMAWWSSQNATAEDRHYDGRYEEVRAGELVENGHVI